MVTSIKMNKWQFWDYLFQSNKHLIVALVETLAGLVTRESYLMLKRPGVSRIKAFLARAVITVFLCMLFNNYISDMTPKYHYMVLGIVAITCIPILDWFLKSFLPGLLNSLKDVGIKYLTGILTKKDKEKGENEE